MSLQHQSTAILDNNIPILHQADNLRPILANPLQICTDDAGRTEETGTVGTIIQTSHTSPQYDNPMPIHANLGSIHTDNAHISDGTSTIRIPPLVSARDDSDSPCPTRCQASDIIFPIQSNLPIQSQLCTNLPIRCQSSTNSQIQQPIRYQSCINLPAKCPSFANPSSIQHSYANPGSNHQGITNQSIQCQSTANLPIH